MLPRFERVSQERKCLKNVVCWGEKMDCLRGVVPMAREDGPTMVTLKPTAKPFPA